MAYEIEIASENIVEDTSKAVIAVNDPTADIIANQDNSVDVYSCTYVVVCDDIYIKNYIAEIPAWMQTYIENITDVALASTNTSLTNLINNFQALQDGYTATIASVTSDISAQNASIESLITSTDSAIAGINTALNTKIDQDQALALIAQEIATFRDFGLTEASAWWQAIINTVVTEQQAQATNISTLNSGLNNNSASVSTLQSAVATLDSAIASASQYVTANVGGTELITGFALLSSIDPAGEQISEMVFNAGDFRIYTTTTLPDDTATPIFQATGSDVWFTGKVTFQGLGIDSDTTTIDGGKLTTNTAWIDGKVQSSNYSWNLGTPIGFGLFSTGEQDSGELYNMVGGKIYGGVIDSALLNSSTIAVRNLIVVTDAGYETKSVIAEYPVAGDWKFAPYNSTTGTNRLATLDDTSVGFDSPYLATFATGRTEIHIQVEVYVGTTLVSQGQFNRSWLPSGWYSTITLSGLTFYGGDDESSNAQLYVETSNVMNISGNGNIHVKARCGHTDGNFQDLQYTNWVEVAPNFAKIYNI